MILAWATGTWITFGCTTLLALLLLGRLEAIARMPHELRMVAWSLGLAADADAALLAWLGSTLLLGMVLGIGVLAFRRYVGKSPIGLPYCSPAAARTCDERLPAVLLAMSAGIGEELFFRLLLPLLIALVTGSAAFGFAVSLGAFTMLHRHQGWAGMIAVALVGAWLTYLYMLTGALWIIATLHGLIDVHALVLRPWVSGPFRPSAASPSGKSSR